VVFIAGDEQQYDVQDDLVVARNRRRSSTFTGKVAGLRAPLLNYGAEIAHERERGFARYCERGFRRA
jgi:hypothetical protein